MKQFLCHLQFPHHVSMYIITKWWFGVVAQLGQELFKPNVVSAVAWCSLVFPPHSQFIFCTWLEYRCDLTPAVSSSEIIGKSLSLMTKWFRPVYSCVGVS